MSKSAIVGTQTLGATPGSTLATLFGLAANTLFKGTVVFPSTNVAAASITQTTGNSSTAVSCAAGSFAEYSAVNLSSLTVYTTAAGVTGGDKVVLVGEGVDESMWGKG